MQLRRIYFDHGDGCGCGGAGCSNANSFAEQFVGKQGDQGKAGPMGPSGQNNLLNGSVTDGTTDSDGTDDTIGVDTVADLQAMGFDVETKPTLLATPDPTDTDHNKIFVRLSNAELNFLASLKNKLLPPAGTAGNILVDNGTIWTSSDNSREFYNTTSVTSFSIDTIILALKGGALPTITFTVDPALAYKFGQQVYMAMYNGGTLNPANYLVGVVVSYDTVSLEVLIVSGKGTGTPTEWLISLGSPVQLPYFDATVNNGKFLQNQDGVLAFSDASEYVGKFDIWVGDPTTTRFGWVFADGAAYTNTESSGKYAQLYNFLNWAGSPFIIDSVNFMVPNISGKALAGYNGSEIAKIGSVIGAFQKTIGTLDLPVNMPWVTVPGRIQTSSAGSGSKTVFNVTSLTSASAPGELANGPDSPAKDPTFAANTLAGQPFSLAQPTIGIAAIIKAF